MAVVNQIDVPCENRQLQGGKWAGLSEQSTEPALCLSTPANPDLLVVLLLFLVRFSFFLRAAVRAGVGVGSQRSAPLW